MLSVADGWTALIFAKSVLRGEKIPETFYYWREMHETQRSLTVELISLAPVPIFSSVPAMFLLQKIALKCFDEWRNFCNPLGLGFFSIFFFPLWLKIISCYLLLYHNLETRCCTWIPGFFCFLKENEGKQNREHRSSSSSTSITAVGHLSSVAGGLALLICQVHTPRTHLLLQCC